LNTSDTAIPANLASSEEFDARLKRTDEARWLALRYAPAPDRERLAAIYLLHQELQRALTVSEGMIGKIRIQWWRETLEQIAGSGPVRRHDLALELARVLKDRPDLIAPINALIDRYDDVIDDHLHAGGHQPGVDHEARHLAAEAQLARVAGLALDAAASPAHLDVLAVCGEAGIALAAQLADATTRQTRAAAAARNLPPVQWPAIAHLAAHDTRETPLGPLRKRWRIFRAILTRRL
jgi:phytoene/squalene synthetase